MNTHRKQFAHILIVAMIAAVAINVTYADDLNPPDYRGDPLSVHAHWQGIPGAPFNLVEFYAIEDSNPDTYLSSLPPLLNVDPTNPSVYEFALPNFIDKMPVKYMRLQLTWTGDASPPIIDDIVGDEDGFAVFGNVVFDSPIIPTPVGFYQYYDIEFHPNPDMERWLVVLPSPNYQLVQAVVDTVSTVPEPATLTLLALGGLVLRKRKR